MESTTEEQAMIRQIEADAAAPHRLGCWETYAEVAIEEGMAETGTYDEIMNDGRTLMSHFLADVEPGSTDCQCG